MYYMYGNNIDARYWWHHWSLKQYFSYDPAINFDKYLQFLTTMHNVTTCTCKGYFVTLQGVNSLINVL